MTLNELSKLNEVQARELLERIRWPDGPVCPHCTATENQTKFRGKKHRVGVYKCNECGEQYTVTVNSVMEASHLTIRTWLMAFAIMCSSKKGVSALQLQRQLALGSYRSAWHLAHRIRHAMKQEPLKGLLKGTVEVDEAYVGGKPRRGDTRRTGREGRGTTKAAVIALVERGGRVRAHHIPRVNANILKSAIRDMVDPSARIMTDEFRSYRGIGGEFAGGHHTVTHSKGEYVRGDASTNQVESFFSLLKRGVMGSFHHISRKHLNRYCDEFAYRWSERKVTDQERTLKAIRAGEGKRLTYKTPVAEIRNAPF